MAKEYTVLAQELIQQMNAKADEKYERMMHQNQQLMEQNSKMLDAMTRAAASGGGVPSGEAPSRPVQPGGKSKHKCKHCNRLVHHCDENCLEPKSNAYKRSANWKSVLPS